MHILIILFVIAVFFLLEKFIPNIPGIVVGVFSWFGNLPANEAIILIIVICTVVITLPWILKKLR